MSHMKIVVIKLKEFCLGSIYISPGCDIQKEILQNLLENIPRPFVLCGDFNAIHHGWDNGTTNRIGQMLFVILEELDLNLLNTPVPTRLCSTNRTANMLDISVCSPDMNMLFNWSILDDTHGSDHFPIILQRDHCSPMKSDPGAKLDLRNGNWTQFKERIHDQVLNIAVNADLGKNIQTIIQEAGREYLYRAPKKVKRPSPPWWDAISQFLAAESLSQGLEALHSWTFEHDLEIAPEKCKAVFFSRKRLRENVRGLYIGGTQIPFHSEVRFLGITIDQKLKFNNELKSIVNKCNPGLSIIRSLR
ncbi:Endonuclease-reverse transcriptase [Popillia japonica]|uniref:Endonuclease-reverse transcriptase n=1 Tax=Popillia japonica TaxID=7064 RepID=A0AAW1IY92_POPJA